jgi:hypothetical protein
MDVIIAAAIDHILNIWYAYIYISIWITCGIGSTGGSSQVNITYNGISGA